MKHVHMRHMAAALVVIVAGHAYPALAGGYVGISAGKASVDVCSDAKRLGATWCDDEDTGVKLFGGYVVNDYLSIEGSYTDYGEFDASAPGFVLNAEAAAFAVSVKGEWPIMDSVNVFGKLGYARWNTEVDVELASSTDDDGFGSTFGVGLEYSLTDSIGIRGEWERTEVDGDDADLLSVGVLYRF